jgi:8-oxo-dGTP diphosphatase
MPQKLSYEDFLKSLELCPRLTIELLLENDGGEIFLIKRTKFPFENHWHLPGGFLLKGETIQECIERIAKDEIGIEIGKGEFAGVFENVNGDPRGHIIHYVMKFKVSEIPTSKDKAFFKALPDPTIPYQRDFLSKLGYK